MEKGSGSQIQRAIYEDGTTAINVVSPHLTKNAIDKKIAIIPLDYPGILVLLKEIIKLYGKEEIERKLNIIVK